MIWKWVTNIAPENFWLEFGKAYFRGKLLVVGSVAERKQSFQDHWTKVGLLQVGVYDVV